MGCIGEEGGGEEETFVPRPQTGADESRSVTFCVVGRWVKI